jgi:osmotically-inducible protein OsmY
LTQQEENVRKLSILGTIVALIATGALLTGCERQDTPDYERQTNERLREAKLEDVRVNWNRDERVLRLSGEVQNAAARNRAEEVAGQVVGTAGRVVNEIKIEGVDHGAVDNRIEDQLNRMFEDRTEWDFDGRGVSFDAEAGVVTITGTVESQAIKDRIGTRARQTEGVRDVVNNLEVEPKR